MASEIKAGKAGLVSAWSDAMDATSRAQQIGYEKQANLAEQAAIDAAMATKGAGKRLTAEEVLQNEQRRLALQNSLKLLLVEDSNYGTERERVTKLFWLLQSQDMIDGLASTDEGVRLGWQKVQQTTELALIALQVQLAAGGDAAAKTFLRHLSQDTHLSAPIGTPGQGFAGGTDSVPYSGFFDVGEAGRERVFLPQGAAVQSNRDLMSGGTQIIQLVVSGKVLAQVLANQARLEGR
jgi:hypothetical protein